MWQSVVALRAMPDTLRLRFRTAAPREAEGEAWSQAGSNRRPLACHASALPAELWPQALLTPSNGASGNPDHNSGPISSLLVAADVADNVGHVLVAFLLVGDEG